MPIYAYRCGSCGHAKDVLQRMADPVLTVCPACGESTFQKQVTAAGFQLKGSGWYATDFRGGSTPTSTPAAGESAAPGAPASPEAKPATATAADNTSTSPSATHSCNPGCTSH